MFLFFPAKIHLFPSAKLQQLSILAKNLFHGTLSKVCFLVSRHKSRMPVKGLTKNHLIFFFRLILIVFVLKLIKMRSDIEKTRIKKSNPLFC